MATRNERKRKAKERALAIAEALDPKPRPVTKPVLRGKVFNAAMREQYKASLTKGYKPPVIEPEVTPSLPIEVWRPRQDVFDVPQAIRGHREPREHIGSIVKGKLVSSQLREPAKRDLTFHPVQGRMIEIAKRYYGGKR